MGTSPAGSGRLDVEAFDLIDRRMDAILAATADRLAGHGLELDGAILRFYLRQLAHAVARGMPEPFVRSVRWAEETHGQGVPSRGEIRAMLDALADAVDAQLPPALAARCRGVIGPAADQGPAGAVELPSRLRPDAPHFDLCRAWLDDLLAGRRHEARGRIVAALEAGGVSPADLYRHVLEPAQHEIGRLWQLGRISVAQEHFCTAATQLVMAMLYPRIFASPRSGRTVLVTSVGGELHEIGARMVADYFAMAGWETHYLGADTPATAVAEAVRAGRPDAVALSCTMLHNVREVVRIVDAIREVPGAPVVLVGGRAFLSDPALCGLVGADGTAESGVGAVEAAERLLALRGGAPTAQTGGTAGEAREAAADLGGAAREIGGLARAGGDPLEPLLAEMSRLNNELLGLQRELHLQNERLRRLDREKNALLGMVAHDLRNPLAVVSGLCDALLETAGDADRRQLVERIDDRVGWMGRLVDELVDVAAIEAGHVRLEVQRFDLGLLIERNLELSRVLAAPKQVRIEVERPDGAVEVEGDARKVEQVLLNLVQNAIKFSPVGGMVRVRLTEAPEEVSVSVSDHGVGMSSEVCQRVFRDYVRRGARGTAGEKSTGLGLLICGRIVERHGGRCHVESELGRGSTLGFTLPRRGVRQSSPPGSRTT